MFVPLTVFFSNVWSDANGSDLSETFVISAGL